MKATKMFAKFALGLVVCFIAIGAILYWMADPLYLRAPKDRKLITFFQDHRAAFEKLRQMAAEDSAGYLSESHLDARLSKVSAAAMAKFQGVLKAKQRERETKAQKGRKQRGIRGK